MDILNRLIHYLINETKRKKRWRVIATGLSCIIVFVTTYSLILPAISVDLDTASDMAGMDVAATEEYNLENSSLDDSIKMEIVEPESYSDEQPDLFIDEYPEEYSERADLSDFDLADGTAGEKYDLSSAKSSEMTDEGISDPTISSEMTDEGISDLTISSDMTHEGITDLTISSEMASGSGLQG